MKPPSRSLAKLPHVPFKNSRAERDLGMSKVKQKVSGCFRTLAFAEADYRTSSNLQTLANKGYDPLDAIPLALSGQTCPQPGESSRSGVHDSGLPLQVPI